MTNQYAYNRVHSILRALPLLAFTAVAFTNPFTGILFQINAQNLYERNVGVYFHWVVVWAYFLVPSVQVFYTYLRETNQSKKQELLPMLLFTVAPFIASIIQMFCYGVTSSQVGITISVVMICLAYQDAQVLTDALTGISNRRGLDFFMAGNMQRSADIVYTLVMIDADKFKRINDKYGHI